MENVEQITRDRLPIISDPLVINVPSDRCHKLVPVLFDHETNQLLAEHK